MGGRVSSKQQTPLFKTARFALRLRRSRIDGYGVYAAENIPARRLVIEYTGEKISVKEAERRFWRIIRGRAVKNSYLFSVGRSVIDGAVRGCGAEYINHSCEPNLIVHTTKGRLFLYSLRRIRTGEELTYDYQFDPDSVVFPCYCKSQRWRGTINLCG